MSGRVKMGEHILAADNSEICFFLFIYLSSWTELELVE